MTEPKVYAEDVNYWQTSQSSADTWMEKAKKEITGIGGSILGDAYGNQGGRSAYMLEFKIGADQFKVVWPVLPSYSGRVQAAKIQAATMLYHDVKAKCVSAKVMGARTAFFSYLVLPDGRTASQASGSEIARYVPSILALPSKTE